MPILKLSSLRISNYFSYCKHAYSELLKVMDGVGGGGGGFSNHAISNQL